MARPLRIDYPHAYYHVTCRGNERKEIFRDDQDRSVFVQRLSSSLEIYALRLHAYVLMGNHFHLIVEAPKANLSEFMRHFNVSYTAYYNRRHRRVGHLYQGRFKAILVEADSYLLELSRYVHLNPVRVGRMRALGYKERLKSLRHYPWSSLAGYLESRKRKPWVVYKEVLGYVGGSRERYDRFIREGLQGGYATPWEEVKGQVVLGEEGFWQRISNKWQKQPQSVKEQPSLRVLRSIEPAQILKTAAAYFNLQVDDLTRRRSGWRDQRALVMELMHRHSGAKQREIGAYLGQLDYTLVSRERKRVREKMGHDPKVGKWYKEVEGRLSLKVKI